MSHNYMVIFIIDGFEDISPALNVGGRNIVYIQELSKYAKKVLETEMGEKFTKLWSSSGLPCIQVDVKAEDENSAIKSAWRVAKRVVNALSFVEFQCQNAISIYYRDSPNLLPNVLVANKDEETPTLHVSYYVPTGLMRLNLNQLGKQAKEFNDNITRHIESLMPPELWADTGLGNEVAKRFVNSLQWYSAGLKQQEIELRFISMWFALESIVIESTKTDNKKRKLQTRLNKLYFKHNLAELDYNVLEELWSLRSDFVHEAQSGFLEIGEGLVSARHINIMKYLYLIVTLFILDMLPNQNDLSLMWKNIETYSPSKFIKSSEIPIYLDIVDLFRFEQ